MTAKANHSTPAKPVVLFGLDSRGKPKAARFSKEHAGLAIKAAGQLALQVLSGNDPKLADIAARLPVGRVHATGRTFVPFIGHELYERLLAAADNSNFSQPTAPPDNGTSGGAGGSRPPKSTPRLPRNWQEIAIGDLVLAQQSVEDGWYEAIVLAINGDMLTTRWRDYPRERKIVRHRLRLALLYPDSKPVAEAGKSAKASSQTKRDQPNANAGSQTLPKDWTDIDVNHLVLAKCDSPWGTWVEAIAIEKAGDGFKLRWRDNPRHVAPFRRSRYELALMCPNAA